MAITKCKLGDNFVCFLVVFYVATVFESMVSTFLNSAVQSLERQFQISSSKSGLLISASRFGTVPTVLFIAYFGNKGNKARWIGCSCILISVGCFVTVLPNFLFPLHMEEAYGANGSMIFDHLVSNAADALGNVSQTHTALTGFRKLPFVYCDESYINAKMRDSQLKCSRKTHKMIKGNEWAFTIMLLAVTLFGIGRSVPWTIGTPMIDDRVKRKNAPYYFATFRSTKVMGPLAGSWLAAGCFKVYVTLKNPVGLTPLDPQWIGAWWLGFLLIGFLLLIPSVVLMFFPDRKFAKDYGSPSEKNLRNLDIETTREIDLSRVPSKNVIFDSTTAAYRKVSAEIKTFIEALKCCLSSNVYVYLLLERVFSSFAFRGVYSFIPKFIENHYGVAQHEVNFFLGVVSTLSFAGGTLAGSFIMKMCNLEGRKAVAYTIFCSVAGVLITCIRMTLSCRSTAFLLTKNSFAHDFSVGQNCSLNCHCDKTFIYPVCDMSGNAFLSPCHAGCSKYGSVDDDFIFNNCSCAGTSPLSKSFCINDCTAPLFIYYGLSIVSGIVAGTSQIPSMLIGLRAVPHHVRSVSLAFSIFVTTLISATPSTIVVGRVIDSTCLLWNYVCGHRGACLLYDPQSFRIKLHMISAILRSVSIFFQICVWYWAAGIKTMSGSSDDGEADGQMYRLRRNRRNL